MWNRWFNMVVCVLLLVGCERPSGGSHEVSIGYLRGLYDGYPQLITDNLVVEGEVISSDRYGAYRYQLALQDTTGGVVVLIDNPTLYADYALGDSVRVECCGLTLGGYGGSVRLGGEPDGDWQVSRLAPQVWAEHSEWVGRSERVCYLERRIATLGPADMGRAVVVRGVRLATEEYDWPEEGVTRSVQVVDEKCPTDTLAVRISGHKSFVGVQLPKGVCDLQGVADYFAGDYQITLLSPNGFKEVAPLP